MNKEIANILKSRITNDPDINFLDVVAGLAQTVRYTQPTGDGSFVYKSMPVSYDVDSPDGCQTTPETAIIPDSMKKGILYFEESGTNIIEFKNNRGGEYSSSLTLVCWVNKAQLGYETKEEITAILVSLILKAIVTANNRDNVGNFIAFHVKPNRINTQDNSVFNKYTYDEEATQYLRPPYEYFSIQIGVTFRLSPNCLNEFNLKQKLCY